MPMPVWNGELIIGDHFNRPTVMLTHGSPGEFDPLGPGKQPWMHQFVKSDPRFGSEITVIAIDWHDGGSPDGSGKYPDYFRTAL
jgi:hypothetical protein